jgi:UDP-N-acetyl-D-galactosamine dehydrogenase
LPAADATILAVGHKQFLEKTPAEIMEKTVKRGCFVQVKAAFPLEPFTREGVRVWRL